jgi:predicted nucleic acid-binding Zn ribbon protein
VKSLDKLLNPALGRDEVVRAALAKRALRSWSLVVGEQLGARSCPDRYERGVVFIAVEGSAWAQELRLAKPQILDRLRARAGDSTLFVDLRFGVRPLRPLEPEAPDPEPPAIPTEDGRTIREIAEARLSSWRANGA